MCGKNWINEIIYFNELDSTNLKAKELAEGGASHGLAVVARRQSAGRGRLGRSWISDEGGLFISIILRPDIIPLNVAGITLKSAIAVANAIRGITGLEPEIKWPNDVLIGGKKVCGILCEGKFKETAIDYAVVGIGINLNNEAPVVAANQATSLYMECGKKFEIEKMIEGLKHEYEKLPEELNEILDLYRERCVTIGKEVQVIRGEERYAGYALDVTAEGHLAVKSESKGIEHLSSGEVSIRGAR